MKKSIILSQQDLFFVVKEENKTPMNQMFAFTKSILIKVSFDKELFKKELKKNFNLITKREKALLFIWCLYTFGDQYKEIILDVFKFR